MHIISLGKFYGMKLLTVLKRRKRLQAEINDTEIDK